ncbi:response regulator transcription factor [Nocardiopsis sp. RSe5-2]|uniref:Response regulator transcription factor n=1 Tax=Nocardiopsis endophytica TaxID=3018445 RepID=A0ABT4U3P9_9ACTN|nr:response regulator transcription factor [Nocardiopsis endophytica]MDA2811555.1 response regulator transcription factor [Nocardiopsis endophytica]
MQTPPRSPFAGPPLHPEAVEDLTRRELQVLLLVASGCSNREISRRMTVTERTVKAHITRIFEKLDVESRVQAALTFIVSRCPACSARFSHDRAAADTVREA